MEAKEKCSEVSTTTQADDENKPQDKVLNNKTNINANDMVDRRKRIKYDKSFLILCYQHPCCRKKPTSLTNSECGVEVPRLGKFPFAQHDVYIPPRRSWNNRDRDELHSQHRSEFRNGIDPLFMVNSQGHHSNAKRSRTFYDNEYSHNIGRQNNAVVAPNHRNEDGRRTHQRVRFNREITEHKYEVTNGNNNGNNGIHYGNGSHDHSLDWNGLRKRNADSMNDNNGQTYVDYRENDEKKGGESEPEWFSEGPTSKYDTVELHGFMDDIRSKENREHSKENEHGDFSIENILKSEHIPPVFSDHNGSNGGNSSRFSQLFQTRSNSHDNVNGEKQDFQPKTMEDFVATLRNGLLQRNDKENIQGEEKDTCMIQSTKDELNDSYLTAFKKLLEDKVIGKKKNQVDPKTQAANMEHLTNLLLGKKPNNMEAKPNRSVLTTELRNKVNRNLFQDVQNSGKPKQDLLITPHQLLAPLPREINHLIYNFPLSPEFLQIPYVQNTAAALTRGHVTLDELIHVMMSGSGPMRNLLFGILKLCFTGGINVARPLLRNPGYRLLTTPQNNLPPTFNQFMHCGGRAQGPGPSSATYSYSCLAMAKQMDEAAARASRNIGHSHPMPASAGPSFMRN